LEEQVELHLLVEVVMAEMVDHQLQQEQQEQPTQVVEVAVVAQTEVHLLTQD
jgi:hypothetical protein